MDRDKPQRRNPARLRAAPGSSPGGFMVDPNAPPTHIRILAYDKDQLLEQEVEHAGHLESLLGRHRVTWTNVDGLGDEASLREVGRVFGMHHLTLEDVVHVNQRPKVETYGDQIFVVLRMPRGRDTLSTEQFSLIVTEDGVVSFQEQTGDCLDPVRKRIRDGRPRLRTGTPGYLAYALIDAVVDAYFPVLEHIGDRLEMLEERILADKEEGTLEELHGLKRDLTTLRRYVWPLREMLASLLRLESPLMDEETKVHLRDAQDHAIQLLDIVDSSRDVSSSLMDLYLTMVSNRMNEVMKVLTIIATIFIPLSFLAGLYGMNFDTSSPWNLPELSWRYGYPGLLGVMVLVGGGLVLWFKRRGWLG